MENIKKFLDKHKNDKVRKQMYYTKQGIITPHMEFVAKKENLEPEFIRSEIARGRLIIPANVNHINQEPMAIGLASSCKINANIGSSALSSNIEEEIEKVNVCLKYGADTIMDLSTGGDLDKIRTAVINHSTVPIGTVPIYQILHDVKDKIEDLSIEKMLEVIERQAQQGVSYFTIHAGFLLEFMPHIAKRKMGI